MHYLFFLRILDILLILMFFIFHLIPHLSLFEWYHIVECHWGLVRQEGFVAFFRVLSRSNKKQKISCGPFGWQVFVGLSPRKPWENPSIRVEFTTRLTPCFSGILDNSQLPRRGRTDKLGQGMTRKVVWSGRNVLDERSVFTKPSEIILSNPR